MRQHHRYHTSLQCTLTPRAGSSLQGTLTNISAGGAGFVTAAGVSDGPALLDISTFDEALKLPCRIRHAREVWGRATLHLQFGSLSDTQHQALERLIAEVARAGANVTLLRPARVDGRPEPRRTG